MDKHHAFTLAFGAFFAPAFLTILITIGLVVTAIQAKVQQSRLRSDGVLDGRHRSCLSRAGHGCLCPDVTYATYAEYHDIGNVAGTVTAINLCLLSMWGPFYVTNLMVPFCKDMCVDPTLWSLFLWLGYTSAGLCPALWFIDRDVRRQGKALIRCEPRKAQTLPSCSKTGSWYFMDTSANTTANGELKTYRV